MSRYFVTVRRGGASAESITLAVDAADVFAARDKALASAHWYPGGAGATIRVVAA
jgi:hypothetical protein